MDDLKTHLLQSGLLGQALVPCMLSYAELIVPYNLRCLFLSNTVNCVTFDIHSEFELSF